MILHSFMAFCTICMAVILRFVFLALRVTLNFVLIYVIASLKSPCGCLRHLIFHKCKMELFLSILPACFFPWSSHLSKQHHHLNYLKKKLKSHVDSFLFLIPALITHQVLLALCLKQQLGNFFCRGPTCKYFQLFRPYGFSCNYQFAIVSRK